MKKATLKELQKFIKAKAKEYKTDLEDVPAWVIVACAEFVDTKTTEKETLNLLNSCISGNDLEFEDDKEIVKFLRNATEKVLNKMADGYEIEVFKGYKIEINMCKQLEQFTLRQLKEHIGL